MLNNRRFRPIRSAMALLLAGTIAITAVLPAYAYENEIHLINDLGGVGGELSLDQQVDRDWNEDLAGMAMSAWNDDHAGDEDAAPEMTVPAGPKATDSDLNGTADAAVYRAASASNLPKNIRKADSSEKNASCDFLCRLLKETLIPAEAFPREKSLKKMILALDKMNDRDYDVFRMDEEYSPKAGDIVFIAGVPMAAAPATGSELELTPNFFGELFSGGPAATASDLSASTEETGFAAEGKNGLKHRASRAVLGAVVIAGPEERGDGSISLIYSRAKDRVEAGTIQRKDGRIVGFADGFFGSGVRLGFGGVGHYLCLLLIQMISPAIRTIAGMMKRTRIPRKEMSPAELTPSSVAVGSLPSMMMPASVFSDRTLKRLTK